jgi:hypothetical protein
VRAFADVGIFEMLVLAALIDAPSVSGLALYLVMESLAWASHLDHPRGAWRALTLGDADSAAAQDSFPAQPLGVMAGEQKANPESILQAA